MLQRTIASSTRRAVIVLAALALSVTALRAEDRPTITVAVQQIVNAGALDMLREQSNVGQRILPSIFEPLIDMDRQNEKLPTVPALATAWTRIDTKTVELTLRRGVKFHDGSELTADDVIFTFSPARTGVGKQGEGPLFTSGAARSAQGTTPPPEVAAVFGRLWPALDRVEKIDAYTVRFVNKEPDLTLEGRIARHGAEIVAKAAFEAAPDWITFARKPVGTGPYKVVEFKPDNVLVLEAHDAYWGGKPPIKQLRFVVVPEIASRVNGLLSGQYDFVTDIPPDQVKTITGNAKYEIVGGPITNHRLIVFDKHHPTLKDPRVRRAMSHAIDRKLIVEALWDNRTKIPAGLQWEYYGSMFQADWSVPAHDPALAKKLLTEAGYKGEPIPFRVLNNYYTNQVSNAQVLVEMWRAVGLNIQIEMKENWQQIFSQETPRAVRDWSNSAPFNDPVSSIVNQHGPRGQQQQVGEWRNEEFNRLSSKLETSTDTAERKATFRRMLEIAEREDPAYTVLHQSVILYGKRKDIQWKWSGLQSMDFRAGNFKIAK
jgi:peptide/nickel transport system substrate-binding protein